MYSYSPLLLSHRSYPNNIFQMCAACVRACVRANKLVGEKRKTTNKREKNTAKYVRTKSVVPVVHTHTHTLVHAHSIYTHTHKHTTMYTCAQYNLCACRRPSSAVCGNWWSYSSFGELRSSTHHANQLSYEQRRRRSHVRARVCVCTAVAKCRGLVVLLKSCCAMPNA